MSDSQEPIENLNPDNSSPAPNGNSQPFNLHDEALKAAKANQTTQSTQRPNMATIPPENNGDPTKPDYSAFGVPSSTGDVNLNQIAAEKMKAKVAKDLAEFSQKMTSGPDNGGIGDLPPSIPNPPHNLTTGTPPNPYNPGTPNNDYIHGVKGKLMVGPPGGGTALVFYISQISLDDTVEDADITTTQSNGARIRLDGIKEITGTVQFPFDSLNIPGAAPNYFKTRTYVTLNVYPDGVTLAQSFAALITKVSYSTGPMAGVVMVSADYKSTGPITYVTVSQTTATMPLV